jgi:hypothetical protein
MKLSRMDPHVILAGDRSLPRQEGLKWLSDKEKAQLGISQILRFRVYYVRRL